MMVRLMMMAVLVGSTAASAQQTPPPPPRRPVPDTAVRRARPMPAPRPAPAPDVSGFGQGFGSFSGGFGQGLGLSGDLDALRFDLQDRLEMQQDALRDQQARMADQMAVQRDEVERRAQEMRLQMELQQGRIADQAQQAREKALQAERLAQGIRSGWLGQDFGGAIGWGEFSTMPRQAWAPADPADSLYRAARELLNRGEYRRAAQAFSQVPQKFPNSVYAADALYWQAFALFRIGGTGDLHQALTALESQRSKYPSSRTRNNDVSALTMRIQGALAARGDAAASAALAKAAQDSTLTCDREQQSVASQALSALSKLDPDNMSNLMRSVLARKDACSVPLRKNAVMLVGNQGDANATNVLVDVVRNDPSPEVRAYAIGWLGRNPSDEGLAVLSGIVRSTTEDEQIKRAAIRALVVQPSPQAKQLVRTLVESDDVSDRLRADALSAFDRDHATADDIAWLRSLYSKLQNRSLKQRALSQIVRLGGDDMNQWLLSIARNPDESSDLRATALRRVGETLPIADLSKMYDDAGDRTVREQLISIMEDRKEPAATDKLIDIVRTGTDPNLRNRALSSLTRKSKDDPRTMKLLMDLISGVGKGIDQ